MSSRSLYAIMIALLFPLVAYFIVRKKSETAVTMPRHYLPDTSFTVTRKGKQVEDTIWHQLANFTLTNQEGKTITWDSLKGKIVVADFFFTLCPSICPAMTKNMKRLAESIHNGQRVGDRMNKKVHFLSFSIDPERDSVERLKYWANRFQIDPRQWWLLTGDKKTIYDLAIHEMKLFMEDGKGVDTSFVHSDRFVLIDSNRHVRGYYDGLDTASLGKLSKDLVLLTMEKDTKARSFFAGKFLFLSIIFMITILALALFFYFFKKKP